VPDNIGDLKKAVYEASKTGDLIVINAGASAGKKDFTSSVIQKLGEVVLHGVSIKPGKPVILGLINNRPVLGIPGYPVSAYITFEIFAKPLIHTWQGIEMEKPETLVATLSRHIPSTLGIEEFVRVKVGVVSDKVIASPVSRGAGMLMSLVRADGIMRIPAMSEGLGAGSDVEVRLFEKNQGKISDTIVCIGSHDNILDILANFLKKRHPALSLSSAHVGSMGGLIALKRGEAHLAGTHLLDEKTGEYNISYVQRLIPDEKIILVNLVYRQQGLFVLKGNPRNIQGFEDLTREDVTFINRQPGSGTRLLTDKYLKELQIDTKKIKGYDREEYTHMTVASAVLNGIADTGLGICAAAEALGIDFIPLALERYDLAVPEKFYELSMMQDLFEIIQSDMEFRREIQSLGGYDIRDMGRVVYPLSS
jgi:putative molybdopterin biosynthesis protein